jgi:hypothetical protein
MPNEPHSIHPEPVRRFAHRLTVREIEPDRPPPSTFAIITAAGMILAILVLALPALATIIHPAPEAPLPTAAVLWPTAAVAPTATPAAPVAPVDVLHLPATIPAGDGPDDRFFTLYQGWSYLPTGGRQGASCEITVWPDGRAATAADRFWVDCGQIGL